jgi:hypothetical protein
MLTDQLEMILNESVVAYLKVLYHNLFGEIQENHKEIRKLPPGQDSKTKHTEYRTGIVTIQL